MFDAGFFFCRKTGPRSPSEKNWFPRAFRFKGEPEGIFQERIIQKDRNNIAAYPRAGLMQANRTRPRENIF